LIASAAAGPRIWMSLSRPRCTISSLMPTHLLSRD
jgi:hypothetical protein